LKYHLQEETDLVKSRTTIFESFPTLDFLHFGIQKGENGPASVH